MALTATIYSLKIDLSDMDRGVFETLDLRIARQPSETIENMLMRVLAYCMEYQDGIFLTEGVAAGNEPAILVRDLTGKTMAWIEVGMPDAARLHRGMKLAGRAAVYTHRDVRRLLAQFLAADIFKAETIPVYAIDPTFINDFSALIDRRSELSISITDRELFLSIGDRNLMTTVVVHRIE